VSGESGCIVLTVTHVAVQFHSVSVAVIMTAIFSCHHNRVIASVQLIHLMNTLNKVKKSIPDIFSYNSRKYCQIFTIFGRNITSWV